MREIKDGEETDEWSEFSVLDWIKRQLENAKDLFGANASLIDRIIQSFAMPVMDQRQGPSTDIANKMTVLTVEGEETSISFDRARSSLENISRLLSAPPGKDMAGDPKLYGEFEFVLDRYLSSVTGVRHRYSGRIECPSVTWNAVALLSWLGGLKSKHFGVVLVELARRLPKAPNCGTDSAQLNEVGNNPYLLSHLLFRPNVTLPEGWQWPDRTVTRLYWWRDT